MYIDKYISQSRRGTGSLVIKLRGYCSSRSVPWHNVPHRKGALCWWWRSTSHKFQVTAGYMDILSYHLLISFCTLFIYIIIYIKYGLVFVYGCLWVKQESSVQSQKRKPPQISGYQGRHTHTFWPVVIDMFKKNQKSQENESRAIKKTKYFHTEKGDCSCSWVRQLYPVFAPWHSSCKGGTCYHGQKVWVRSAIQELPVSFHHNTWGISSSYK